jgi:hypothetical protein
MRRILLFVWKVVAIFAAMFHAVRWVVENL